MNTKTKHSSGPWEFSQIGKTGEYIIDQTATKPYASISSVWGENNARLIAAAPELLEALKECDKAFVSWQVGQIPGRPEDILALITKTRAAIAKAEGSE